MALLIALCDVTVSVVLITLGDVIVFVLPGGVSKIWPVST